MEIKDRIKKLLLNGKRIPVIYLYLIKNSNVSQVVLGKSHAHKTQKKIRHTFYKPVSRFIELNI